jgi:hypothetical protein
MIINKSKLQLHFIFLHLDFKTFADTTYICCFRATDKILQKTIFSLLSEYIVHNLSYLIWTF